MQTLYCRNVNELLPKVIQHLHDHGVRENSRAGEVYVARTPVISVYSHPKEKVLFSSIRDQNPFFTLMEAMWMLHGDDDAEFLDHYIRDFGSRFAEKDDYSIHGAYGQRWRTHFGFDQLKTIIRKFKENSLDRQCVLQMWDPHLPDNGANDLLGTWADRPCNVTVFFRIEGNELDMTTVARSHDGIWGSTGANVVHFPIMQEYLAGMIGVEVGKFYQFSNNLHMYVDVWKKLEAKLPTDKWPILNSLCDNRYEKDQLDPQSLVTNPQSFDYELDKLMLCIRHLQKTGIGKISHYSFKNSFLRDTVYEMAFVHHSYKNFGAKAAVPMCETISAPDWQVAAREWLGRRTK